MGLLKTAAKVAVASHVHGRVQRRQSQRWAAQDAAAAASPPAAARVAPTASIQATDDLLTQLSRLGELRRRASSRTQSSRPRRPGSSRSDVILRDGHLCEGTDASSRR